MTIMAVGKSSSSRAGRSWQEMYQRPRIRSMKRAVKSMRGGDGVAWIRKHDLGKGSYGFVSFVTSKAPIINIVCSVGDDNDGGGVSDCISTDFAVKSAEVSASSSLRRETKILLDLKSSSSSSPHVVRCYGEEITCSTVDSKNYYNILMELCEGGSLAKWIAERGTPGLSEYQARVFARHMVLGLVHIHSRGYVHCDIKPLNVLLAVNGDGGFIAKIADFGLAKKATPEEEEEDEEEKFGFGGMRGTHLYLPPETVNDGVQDQSSDIWALGCTVVEMLTGRPMWKSDFDAEYLSRDSNIRNTLRRIGNSPEYPELPSHMIISREAKDFLQRCLMRSPRRRWSANMLIHHPFLQSELSQFSDRI